VKLEESHVNKLSPAFRIVMVAFLMTLAGLQGSASAQSLGLGVKQQSHQSPRFYGFSFDFTVSDGTGLNNIGENYRNDLSFYFEPTWNYGKMFFHGTRMEGAHIAARFILTQNLAGTDDANFTGNTAAGPQGTCSNITPGQGGVVDPTMVAYCHPATADRRADYSDFWLTFRFPKIYTIPKIGVNISPSLRFVFPSSAQSQFATLQTSITGFLGLSRAFWGGKIRTGYTFGFNKFIHKDPYALLGSTSQTGASTTGGNPNDGAAGAGISNFYLDPTRFNANVNPSYAIQNILSLGVQAHAKVGIDLLYITVNNFAYSQSCDVSVGGYIVNTCTTGDAVASNSGSSLNRPGRRDSQVLWLAVNYSPLDYVTLTLAWINAAPMYYGNSTYRQGIISTNYDAFTTLSLGATVSLDGAADKIWKRKN